MDQVEGGAKAGPKEAKQAEVQPVCVRRASFAALPEIPAIDGTIPRVRTDMHFKGLQDPYSACHQVLTSSLNAASIDTMLSGGLKNFFEKYNKLAETTNLQLQTPEIRFSNLSFSAQSSANSLASGTVGSYLRQLFFPFCCKPPSVEKTVLHPMSGVIPPGSMTLVRVIMAFKLRSDGMYSCWRVRGRAKRRSSRRSPTNSQPSTPKSAAALRTAD